MSPHPIIYYHELVTTAMPPACLSKVVAVIQAKREGCGELRNTEQGSEVDNKYAQQINVEYVG